MITIERGSNWFTGLFWEWNSVECIEISIQEDKQMKTDIRIEYHGKSGVLYRLFRDRQISRVTVGSSCGNTTQKDIEI